MIRSALIVSVLALSCLACGGSSSLNSSSALAVLNQQFAEAPILYEVPFGEVQFYRPVEVRKGNQVHETSRGLYGAFAQKGLLEISDERDLTSGFSGWDDWFTLTQAGITRTATVSLTDMGAHEMGFANASAATSPITIRLGAFKVQRLLRMNRSHAIRTATPSSLESAV